MITKWNRKCRHCGDTFYSERNTAKFCPDKACRTKWHRDRTKSIETPLKQALDAITTLGRAYDGNFSYSATAALKTIAHYTAYSDVAGSATWWRCRKCRRAIQRELPDKAGCRSGGDHEWHYQKTRL